MKKLFKIGLLSVGLMTVLGTSIHAAPTPTSTVPPQSTYMMAAKVQDISIVMMGRYKLNKNYHYATTTNSKVAYVNNGYIHARTSGTAIVRLYNKNDVEIAAYRVRVYDI
ncbi:hypothetical protein FLT15_17350 [Paenibacillus thiaminolyticus]|uniref:hypothetical protein n=1 Tax=Paenibacillus thiaminolyticus TaxID=49283 RepID=UPI001165BF69|nr:hypothetical protein [Paenibacillus thiaminolyticus]NGP58138.1 hypothetical protein [Paenibacillus thiaminolyticus]NGP60042.1 hypothetical protein [Paenibacillus thiaminolyticus]